MSAGCPGANRCARRRPQCGHLALVDAYRDALTAHLLAREAANPGMYPTELAEWDQAHPAPLFRDWLVWSRRTA